MVSHAIHDVPYIADPVEVGRGGFATVHRAMDLQADRPVAVKLLAIRTEDENLKYFDRERESLARLSTHPNVVTLHRTGITTGGVPYLVMEFAPGGSLADRVRAEGSLSWSDAVTWLLPICGAVQHANEQGIRHRDIKPQNILISAHGTPLLSDFGIAGRAAGNETTTHKAKLSLSYASPEQIEGRELDDSTDVYSLGATLYTLIAGAPAFADTNGAGILNTAKRILAEPPPPLDNAVPEDIRNAIAAAMAKNPSYRPTVAEFRSALSRETALDPPPPGDEMPEVTRELALPHSLPVAAAGDPILSPAADEWSPTLPGFDERAAAEQEKRSPVAALLGDTRRSLSVAAIALLMLGGLATVAWAGRGGPDDSTATEGRSSALSPVVGSGEDQSGQTAQASLDQDGQPATAGPSEPDSSTADSSTSGVSTADSSTTGSSTAGSSTPAPSTTVTTTNPDGDGDGTLDADDNCPDLENQDQANQDGDTYGDACDPDDDDDGVSDAEDNCRLEANPDQEDVDLDQLGDACDDFPDRDADGIIDTDDDCVEAPDDADTDGDGTPDKCDSSPQGMTVVAASAQIDRVTVINDDGKPDMFGDLVVAGTKFNLPEITDQADIRPGNWVSDRVPVEPDSPTVRIRIWLRDESGFCLFCKDDLVDITPVSGMNALHLVVDTETGAVDLAGKDWNRLETVGTLLGSVDGDLSGAVLQLGDDDNVHRASIEVSITLAREPAT